MNISDKELLKKVSDLVLNERKASEAVLLHLEEVFRRRLFADLGYSSLFNYLVKELKYSEGAAGRRVNLLKLSKKVPEVRRMVIRGELSLSVVSMAQTFSKKLGSEETKLIVSKLKNKSKDEAELELLKISPKITQTPKEIRKRVTVEETRIHLCVKNTTLEKLELIKDMKKLDTNAALDYLVDLGLKEHQKSLRKINKPTKTKRAKGATAKSIETGVGNTIAVKTNDTKPVTRKDTRRRYIPVATKKRLYLRAMSRCEYQNCRETHGLEVEHIMPYSIGGTHDLNNLRLFCRAHNQRAAILFFGQEKMGQFL